MKIAVQITNETTGVLVDEFVVDSLDAEVDAHIKRACQASPDDAMHVQVDVTVRHAEIDW